MLGERRGTHGTCIAFQGVQQHLHVLLLARLQQGLVLLPAWGQPVASVVADGLVGVVTGGLVLLVVNGFGKLFLKKH